ncbi:hypothetical protein BH09GEM1_BH09GEM1_35170 [soil metagenome]
MHALSRTLTLFTLVMVSACAGATPSADPAPVATRDGGATMPSGGAAPLIQSVWPVRTREHLDLWLHSYALITRDTTLVPYFRRGYHDRIAGVRRTHGVSTLLDTNRARLVARIDIEPSLATNGQFLPLYFSSWDQMRQVIDQFLRGTGSPASAGDQTTAAYFSILGGAFPSAADREWLRLFVGSVDDESRRFYHDYWTSELRARAAVVSHVDSLWQRQWRPTLQRFLNNSQQQSGELYLSLPLGGEGRTVMLAKNEIAVAGPMPESLAESDVVLYVLAHEATGGIASAAIADNTSPADRRAGLTSRFEQAAAVRSGALLIEKTIPAALPGYMRFYLQSAGRPAPTDPRAAFAAAFVIPDAVRDAMSRQIDVILGGI